MCKQLTETNDITDFLFNIYANLLSDLLFILILFLFTWFLYFFTKRQKLYKFFSITDTKRLNIYLSRLLIQNGGAIGVNGNPASYQGISIVYNEAMAANKFRDNFNYLSPSLSDKPGLLSKILLSDVSVRSIVSVANINEVDNTTSHVTFGSPTYNLVSGLAQNNAQSHVQFENNGTSVNVIGIQPMKNLTYGFIQRIYDRQNKRSIFYAAGLTELGTIGAANFLATNWNILYKKYKGESNFLVVLDFNVTNYNNWNIVLEKTW